MGCAERTSGTRASVERPARPTLLCPDTTRLTTLFPEEATRNEPKPAPPEAPSKKAKKKRVAAERPPAAGKNAAQAALEARKAALIAVWLAHPATVPEPQMSETERRRFYSGMARLAQSSLTLEELPALLDAQARWSRGTYTPDPHALEASLGTLRREAAAWKQKGAIPQKGTSHNGHTNSSRGPALQPHPSGLAGIGGANHAGDAAILAAVARVRARQQAAVTSVEHHPDATG